MHSITVCCCKERDMKDVTVVVMSLPDCSPDRPADSPRLDFPVNEMSSDCPIRKTSRIFQSLLYARLTSAAKRTEMTSPVRPLSLSHAPHTVLKFLGFHILPSRHFGSWDDPSFSFHFRCLQYFSGISSSEV